MRGFVSLCLAPDFYRGESCAGRGGEHDEWEKGGEWWDLEERGLGGGLDGGLAKRWDVGFGGGGVIGRKRGGGMGGRGIGILRPPIPCTSSLHKNVFTLGSAMMTKGRAMTMGDDGRKEKNGSNLGIPPCYPRLALPMYVDSRESQHPPIPSQSDLL